MVAGTFADLERAVRDLCQQIDQLAEHIPAEEDRAYAGVAKECLWKMYQRAYEHALAREGRKNQSSYTGQVAITSDPSLTASFTAFEK
jgi:hypothetical protein